MSDGFIIGLSVGLAVLVLIILVFGCKFARKIKKDVFDVSKEQLLQHGGDYRHKKSQNKYHEGFDSGDFDYKTKSNHKTKSSKRKSVTFTETEDPDANGGSAEEGTRQEPKQRLFTEYIESNDNNGSYKDEWIRNCKPDYKDYAHKNAKYFFDRGQTKQSKTHRHGHGRGVKRLKPDKDDYGIEMTDTKHADVHKGKHYETTKAKTHRSLPRNVTVKQIVEEVKQNSNHNLDNGTHIKVGYDNLYTEAGLQAQHEYERNDVNTSSGRSAGQRQSGSRYTTHARRDRLLSRPQESLPPLSPEQRIETSADRSAYNGYQYQYSEQAVQRPRREEMYAHRSERKRRNNQIREKPQVASKPQRKSDQSDREYYIDSEYGVPSTEYDDIDDGMTYYGHGMSVFDEPFQDNTDTKTAKSSGEYHSFSEALATWVNHSESGVKIPQPSTTVPYIVYSQKPSIIVNAQKPTTAPSRVEPYSAHTAVDSKGPGSSRVHTRVPKPPSQPAHAFSPDESNAASVPEKQRSSVSYLPPNVLQTQRSPLAKSSAAQQPKCGEQKSPTRQVQFGSTETRPHRQGSPTLGNVNQTSPRQMQQSPEQQLPRIQNIQTYTEEKMNDDPHASCRANIQSFVPKPPSAAVNIRSRGPMLSPMKDITSGPSGRPKLSPPTPPTKQSPKKSEESLSPPPPPEVYHILQENSLTAKSSESLPPPPLEDGLNTLHEKNGILEFTPQMQAEIQCSEQIGSIPKDVILKEDNENSQTKCGNKSSEQDILGSIQDLKSKDSVDLVISESDFNPGQTSTPQQSTTEVPEDKVERSDGVVLHSILKKRRERIGSSTHDMSHVCSDYLDSYWDESSTPIRRSLSVDGTLSRNDVVEQSENSPTVDDSMSNISSVLTEKIATVRHLRNDPDINAVLADIKAKRKSSTSLN